jgi:hypothetical protein
MPTGSPTFAGWNDVGCSGDGTCSFTVTQTRPSTPAALLHAHRGQERQRPRRGDLEPAGINCGADCDQVYPAGTLVTLAAADPDSMFTGWSDGGCTTPALHRHHRRRGLGDRELLPRYTLIARTGTGTGTVDPALPARLRQRLH